MTAPESSDGDAWHGSVPSVVGHPGSRFASGPGERGAAEALCSVLEPGGLALGQGSEVHRDLFDGQCCCRESGSKLVVQISSDASALFLASGHDLGS